MYFEKISKRLDKAEKEIENIKKEIVKQNIFIVVSIIVLIFYIYKDYILNPKDFKSGVLIKTI